MILNDIAVQYVQLLCMSWYVGMTNVSVQQQSGSSEILRNYMSLNGFQKIVPVGLAGIEGVDG